MLLAFGWDMIFFKHFPTPVSITGAGLIVGSALAIAWLRTAKQTDSR